MLLIMCKFALALASLSFSGHGWRVRASFKRLQSAADTERQKSLEAASVPSRVLSLAGVDLKSLARVPMPSPALAFQPFGRTLSDLPSSALDAHNHLRHRVVAGSHEASSLHHVDAVALGVEHGALLPVSYTSRIPKSDERILDFILTYLESDGLRHVPVYVNGGYVRDLLLEKEPADLDLSVCLRGISPEVTVEGLLRKMSDFAEQRPDLDIRAVTTTAIPANEAKDKKMTTFKSVFLNDAGEETEVDLMPTTGQERLKTGGRIHVNDRGSAEEDALDRDLTVGAMLLQVERGPNNHLSFRLFDYYGGVSDLRAGILRAPFPLAQTYEEVAPTVLHTEDAKQLAESLALSSRPDGEALQILWWAKLLMDDPIRICRALRFVATLPGFVLHRAFWDAVPFAYTGLHSTVAGSRKIMEYSKIATCGFQACSDFIVSVFTRTFGPSNQQLRLAPALFGGLTATGKVTGMSEIDDFDAVAFEAMAAALRPADGCTLQPCELLGGMLVAAIASATGLQHSIEEEFKQACDGMCASRFVLKAGRLPARASAEWIAEKAPPGVLDCAFAEICGLEPTAMRIYAQAWQDFGLPGSASNPAWPLPRRELARGLCCRLLNQSEACNCDITVWLTDAMQVVQIARPKVKGKVLNTPGVLDVPPKLRNKVIALLEMTLRKVGCDAPVENGEDLQALFDRFPEIRSALSSENLNLAAELAEGKT